MKKQSITLSVSYEGKPDSPLDATAYAFDRSGRLLHAAALESDKAEITLEEGATPHARILIGPTLSNTESTRVTIDALERLGAFEAVIKLPEQGGEVALFPIPRETWKRWFLCRCTVTGRVVRPVTIGGVVEELPVCNATVYVEEVDAFPRFILKLPDIELYRLRDQLFHEIEAPRLQKLAITKAPLPPEARSALLSDSAPILRKQLSASSALILPLLCGAPWKWLWTRFVTTRKSVVHTDDQGRFQTTIWHSCLDTPDLYFWVQYPIDGSLATVYKKPVPCDTHWNYVCGTDITIRVTDSRVPACAPTAPAGLSIDVKRVGATGYLHRIRSSGADRGLIAWDNTLDPRAEESGQLPVPFGKNLYLYCDFSHDLRQGTVATHYRWSYRWAPSVGAPGAWTPITADVVRNFIVHLPGGLSRSANMSLKETLSSGVYFKIPPNAVPAELHPDGMAEWTVFNERIDLATASLDTAGLGLGLFTDPAGAPQGLYELKLELFRKNTSGGADLVNLTTAGVGVNVWGLTGNAADPVDFVAAGADHLIQSSTAQSLAFRMLLRVDNNPLSGATDEAFVAPFVSASGESHSGAAGPCGFVDYPAGGANVTLGFRATQRNGFATYAYHVWRGSAGVVSGPTATGRVWTAPPPYVPTTVVGGFRGVFSSASLMAAIGGVACDDGRAAFAQTLSLVSLITDGNDWTERLTATPKAFALNPV